MIALWLMACTCQDARKPRQRITVEPSVDRTAVQKTTCYTGPKGRRLELEVSARSESSGTLFHGTEEIALWGYREGRMLRFDDITVELLGQRVAVTEGGERTLYAHTGCGQSDDSLTPPSTD